MKTPISTVGDSLADNSYLTKLISIILVVTSVRVIALLSSELNFHGDEAQYWTWSRTVQWGYYSKPPLVAWLIKLNTGLCGNQESCLRLFSPLMHSITAGVIFYTSYYLSKDIKKTISSAVANAENNYQYDIDCLL